MFDLQHIVQKVSPEKFFKNAVIKSFVKFIGKHLCQSLILIKLQVPPPNFTKKDIVAFTWILRNFLEQLKRTASVIALDHSQDNTKYQHCRRNDSSVNVKNKEIPKPATGGVL